MIFKKHGEVTDAEKRMNTLHFESDPPDIRIQINLEIRIRIWDYFWLRFWFWRRLALRGSGLSSVRFNTINVRKIVLMQCEHQK